jgi:multicomponent Na+:H+ antiporter subunit C
VDALYVNPLPHVLILTAIVVGVSVTAVGLSLIVRIHEEYGVIDEADLVQELRRR